MSSEWPDGPNIWLYVPTLFSIFANREKWTLGDSDPIFWQGGTISGFYRDISKILLIDVGGGKFLTCGCHDDLTLLQVNFKIDYWTRLSVLVFMSHTILKYENKETWINICIYNAQL